MFAFFDIVSSFPTVIASVLVAVSVVWWLIVLLGAADLDALDAGFAPLDSALDGLDTALDGVDAGVDAAESAVESSVEASSGGPLVLLASVLRLGRVPLTVSLTALVVWAWILGFVLTWLLRAGPPGFLPHWVATLGIFAGSWGLAAGLTRFTVAPFEGMFATVGARNRQSLVGEVCEVTTGRVDAVFGQASAQVGGDDLLFQIRCDKPNRLRKGDLALIVHFDGEREAFVVEPMASLKLERSGTRDTGPLSNPALVNKEV